MSYFDWQVSEDEKKEDLFDRHEPPRHGRGRGFWLGTLALLLLMIGGWGAARWQLNRGNAELRQQVQNLIDFEREAYLNGDGELFFSVQADKPAWFSDQLQPHNQAFYQAEPQVTKARLVDETILANISWQMDKETLQRVMFFEWQNGRLTHTSTAPDYWGTSHRKIISWGALTYAELDEPFSDDIIAFVKQTVSEVCQKDCLTEQYPFTLVLTTDFSHTAVPDRINIPSPRLLGLNEEGQPSNLFWETVEQRVQTHLTPTTIKFAVPSEIAQLVDYEEAAAAFMAANPHINVEIVTLNTNPDRLPSNLDPIDPAELLAYDGAALPLTETILASGKIVDLTDYVRTDPDFDQADFYEQIWQGAFWHGRMWLLPQAGAMKVIYLDKPAYQKAEYPEPSLRWTWDEMAQDMIIVSQPYSDENPKWGFLDAGNDALFSYAYNWENDCTEPVTVRCNHPLTTEAAAAALDWYTQMAGQPGQMPNILEIKPQEAQNLILNWQSARRKAAIWVDEPINYEFRLLLSPLGVVPFPGSNRFDGITPLRVHGHFISQSAENPDAVWEWLKFLSNQPLKPQFRYIPARPSAAEETRFWRTLPSELGNVMRIAFPFARPVTFHEQHYFTPDQLTAVLSGKSTPQEAVHLETKLIWFQSFE